MASLENISVKINNYKCFGEDGYGYDKILPINLIIGRNNTGKSTLIDLIEYLVSPKDLKPLGHRGQAPRVTISGVLAEEELRRVFQSSRSGGSVPGNHWTYGSRWIGANITWEILPKKMGFIGIDPPFDQTDLDNITAALAQNKGNPFTDFAFKRLVADRDIVPEPDNALPQRQIEPNGRGVTNAIQNFINKVTLPSPLVEETLLNELNTIFEPDATFTDIVVQQDNIGLWEIYLEEIEKGRVPLSHSGSGLKTILLVLVFLYLVPHIEGKPLGSYLFGFEELENNLHPALQRRLLLYLRKIAVEKGCRFFLTTHSNIAIDLFASDDQAQILHVTHDRRCASVKHVTTYVENRGILDDLDIRASDLLQANGIVWLEGPSDRLYFNRWIEVWTDGQLKEGAHYQCVFYGGRLLAHLSVNDPTVDTADVIKILRVNRNAIVVVDSDKRKKDQGINATKERILSEIRDFGGIAWLTDGKEVENYIPTQALESLYTKDKIVGIKQYEDMASYLDRVEAGEGKRFLRNKVLFADHICPFITREGIINTLDLADRIETVCSTIRRWNGSQ